VHLESFVLCIFLKHCIRSPVSILFFEVRVYLHVLSALWFLFAFQPWVGKVRSTFYQCDFFFSGVDSVAKSGCNCMCSVSWLLLVFRPWMVKIRFTYSTFTSVYFFCNEFIIFISFFVSMLSWSQGITACAQYPGLYISTSVLLFLFLFLCWYCLDRG